MVAGAPPVGLIDCGLLLRIAYWLDFFFFFLKSAVPSGFTFASELSDNTSVSSELTRQQAPHSCVSVE